MGEIESSRAGGAGNASGLSDLVRDSADGIVVVDEAGVVRFANPAAEALLGRERLGGEGYQLGYPSVGREPMLVTLRQQNGATAVVEMRVARTTWEGAPAFVVNLRDVTERQRATEQIRFQARLLGSIGEAIVVTDPDGVIQYWNRAAVRLFGWSAGEAIGRPIAEIVASPKLSSDVEALREGYERGERWSGELLVRPKKGGLVPVRVADTPVFDTNGGLEAVIGVFSDLSEIHRAHDESRRSLQRTQEVLENILDGFASLDDELSISYFNAAAERMIGRTRGEVLGRPLYEVFPELQGVVPEKQARMAVKARRTLSFEIRLDDPRNAGWYAVRVHPAVRGMSVFFEEITERKEMEEEHRALESQLQQAQKMDSIGRLAGGVAHDFNNVLQAITGFSELLRQRMEPEETTRHFVDQILNGAHRAAELTQQLLGFARKQTIAPRPLDLNETIEGLLRMLRRLIREDIELQWKPAQRLPHVMMDPVQIDQILVNLTVNARDAIEGVGTIVIATEAVRIDEGYSARRLDAAPGSYVLLSVRDSGPGIDEEIRDKIFEPFFTTKEIGRGTGLGLSTIYGIVKQNEGFIDVASEAGSGTTFRVFLRSYEEAAGPAEESEGEAVLLRGSETVLLVEDEESILSLARLLLEKLGYRVLTADRPSEALSLSSAHEGGIDLLLTDVVMPEMNGRDLWHRLRVERPELKCLFMSGYAEEVIAHRGALEEDLHFLQKPFSAEVLSVRMREALGSPEASS